MFGEVAVTLLKMMGQSGSVPGAILATDIPVALARLQGAVAANHVEPAPPAARDDQRAFPLIELLGRAIKKDADVIWEEERPLTG
jgi:hypothetical protein